MAGHDVGHEVVKGHSHAPKRGDQKGGPEKGPFELTQNKAYLGHESHAPLMPRFHAPF